MTSFLGVINHTILLVVLLPIAHAFVPNISNCKDFTNDTDTYRICEIFKDANMTHPSLQQWWFNGSNVCNWPNDNSIPIITCNSDNRVTDIYTNHTGMDVFSNGILHFSPADSYPWPDQLTRLDLQNIGGNVFANWSDFSNLPNSLTYLNLNDMYNLHGTLDISTLPNSLSKLELNYCYQLYINFSDLTSLPIGMMSFNARNTNALPPYTFDWDNLPPLLLGLNVRYCGLKGTMNLTNLPTSISTIYANNNQFDNLLLPNYYYYNNSNSSLQLVGSSVSSLSIYSNVFNNNISELDFRAFSGLSSLILQNDSALYGNIDWLLFPYELNEIIIENLTSVEGITNNINNGFYDDNNDYIFNELYEFSMNGMNFAKYALDELLTLLPVGNNSTNLTIISLSNNNIGGSLSLVDMTKTVNVLDLSWNKIYGDISLSTSHLTQFSQLYQLDLSHNSLNGTVDWEVFSYMDESVLDIDIYLNNNQLSGTISLSTFPRNVYTVNLSNNMFFGDINFNQLNSKVRFLYLNNNQFNGTFSLSYLTNSVQASIVELYIQNNKLSGTIDWQLLGTMYSLNEFLLNNNHFYGHIDLSNISTNLRIIHGYDNNFNGTININGITHNLDEVFFYNNSDIKGGINFNSIYGNKSFPTSPKLYFDEYVYCSYCINVPENNSYLLESISNNSNDCWIPQDRNNTPNGYCAGIVQCNNTCTPCKRSKSSTCTIAIGNTTNSSGSATMINTTTSTTSETDKGNNLVSTYVTLDKFTSTFSRQTEKNTDDDYLASLIESWQLAGYFCLFGSLITPLILMSVAITYHRQDRFKGCDKPNYFSIFTVCFMFGDFYSDLIFSVILALSRHYLWYFAIFFALIPHFVSNFIGLYNISQWQKYNIYISKYLSSHETLMITVSCFSGFYCSIELLTSKLFYFDLFGLQLKSDDYNQVQNFKLFNVVLFELSLSLFTLCIVRCALCALCVVRLKYFTFLTLLAMMLIFFQKCSATGNSSIVHYGHSIIRYNCI